MIQKEQLELVKQLREETGVGQLNCKKALEINDWDYSKAIEWLRNYTHNYGCLVDIKIPVYCKHCNNKYVTSVESDRCRICGEKLI